MRTTDQKRLLITIPGSDPVARLKTRRKIARFLEQTNQAAEPNEYAALFASEEEAITAGWHVVNKFPGCTFRCMR